ncbi:enamine deaminase RidA [Nocardioides aromaticivorans]|uniref:Enamine deaminase RidA n=1 Tax=Nocardioides aromaticivorans TaxID=200618 RepID=A0ABX7PGP7_9ACTN|nr:Rid family hydrolase [Nocardioides aromaticivorans]QSR24850.1 enamine deaminase RidA [Nocardioides aromaticivorans]
MVVEYFDGAGLLEPHGYRHSSRAAGVVHIAGQVGVDAEGRRVGERGDYAAQAEKAMDNVLLAFAGAGAGPEHIAHLTYYVVDLDAEKAEQVNRGIGRTLRRHGMQSVPGTMIGITGLMYRPLLIEINGTAVVDG